MTAVAIVFAACSSGSPTPTTGTVPVAGYVHAGPVCPVVQDPPDPSCADRPVAGAAMRILDTDGNEVAVAATAADGTFSVLLSPGTYTLEPQPVAGLVGTAARQTFAIGTETVTLDVAYDTGIR